MAKFIDPLELELDAIAPAPVDSETDAPQTATGLEPDAMQDGRPSVDAPVSIAEAAKLLGINADTARKRHLPRILEAIAGTAIEDQVMVVTGTTRAGNPVKRLSPLGFELLADFQSTGGDVEAIESWQHAIAQQYALPDEAIEPETEAIDPEIEPAGVLTLADGEIEAIEVAGSWLAETGEMVAADWEAVDQHQLNLLDLLNQGGQRDRRGLSPNRPTAGSASGQRLSTDAQSGFGASPSGERGEADRPITWSRSIARRLIAHILKIFGAKP